MMALFYNRQTINGVKKLKKISKSTLMVLEEAEMHGVVWEKIPNTGLFNLEYKGQTKYFHAQVPSETTEFAYHCCKNKQLAKNILTKAGLSVSNGYLLKHGDKEPYRFELYDNLVKPLVVKQADASQGKNVYLNINTQNKYTKAIEEINSFNGKRKVDILVEEMFKGKEYRILATQTKILSVIKRITVNVIGDGKSTITELIEVKNQDPIRINISTYRGIVIDKQVIDFLGNQNLKLESILDKDRRVFLRPKSPFDINLGGDTVDVTDKIHPSVSKIVRKIMKSIPGLALTGIDYMTENIYAEQTSENYKIIEINASPSLDWNEYPLVGPRRRVAYEFLKIMFPKLRKRTL